MVDGEVIYTDDVGLVKCSFSRSCVALMAFLAGDVVYDVLYEAEVIF